jgi:hypothetical protein
MDAYTEEALAETQPEPGKRGRRRKTAAAGRRRQRNSLVDALRSIPTEDRQAAVRDALQTIAEEEMRPGLLMQLHQLSTGELSRLLQQAAQ